MPVEIRELLIQAQVGKHKSDKSSKPKTPSKQLLPERKEKDDCETEDQMEDLKEEIMDEMKRWVKEYFRNQQLHY